MKFVGLLSFLFLLAASVVATVIQDELTEHGVIKKRGYAFDNCGRCIYVPDKGGAPKRPPKEKPQKPREPDPIAPVGPGPAVNPPEVDPSGKERGGKSSGGCGGGGGGSGGGGGRRSRPPRKTPSAGSSF